MVKIESTLNILNEVICSIRMSRSEYYNLLKRFEDIQRMLNEKIED